MDNYGGNEVGLGEKVNLMNETVLVEDVVDNSENEFVFDDDKLPTSINDNGDEVVVFDEELVREGFEKWKNTVCGYFIGCNMPIYKVKYNLRRMWGKYGLKEIVVDEEGMCFIKFRSEEGENCVNDQSPWMVNEAWSTKAISTLYSRLRRPIMMDQMTDDMCNKGIGILRYARVLVEIEAAKEIPKSIELNYVDKHLKCKRTKWVKVEYVWKPILCNHCNVFGHNINKCSVRPRAANENEQVKVSDNNEKMRDGFQEVRNRRDKYVDNIGSYAGNKNGYQRSWNASKVETSKFMFRPKMTNIPGDKEKQNGKEQLNYDENPQEKNDLNKDAPSWEKSWNIGSSKMGELRRSANKYVVLSEDNTGNVEKHQEDPMDDKRLVVDEYVKKKLQPTATETKNWSDDMIKYFKYSWEAMKRRESENSKEEDVCENTDLAVVFRIEDEVNGERVIAILKTRLKTKNINRICDSVLGSWSWLSNITSSPNSCRIVIGWNAQKVKVMPIHSSKQSILCLVEFIPDMIKVYVNFVYASNNGIERRELWNTLQMNKSSVGSYPWGLMGDFNVTLKPEEHFSGSSGYNGDTQEFNDVVNGLEIKDLCSSGFHFTWTKSLKNPDNSILKKLDRMMVNKEFLKAYCRAHGAFLPFLVSDRSAVVVIFPDGLPRKVKSFRSTNYIVDKHEFLDIVRKGYDEDIKLEIDQYEDEKDPFNKEKRCVAINTLEEYPKVSADELKLLHQKAKKKLSKEDAEAMIVEVTDKVIKDAIFDIDSAKASGSDGYTSWFFKKAWDIIGKEVCATVKIFFTNGRLLGEFNSTLIALVLKIKTHNKISDFRPTTCCNVLYKCISKILTNRIKNGLSKVLSINQSAFIPESYHQDNILLTQELLRGYNRKQRGKRYAMKIDIQKACDTVSWSFHEEVLCKVGFHRVMVNWIMTCISTTSFLICVNGEICGYFKGGRGLRQGNLMSPYIFTLVMEVLNVIMIKNINEDKKFIYHYGCKELKLTHLCFADDLLMLCNGDVDSLREVKKSLDEFNSVSDLFPNHRKSTIFFGCIMENKKQELLEVMPFKRRRLPMKYLGVPLRAKILGINDCQDLIEIFYGIQMILLEGKLRLSRILYADQKSKNGRWNWLEAWIEDHPELLQIHVPFLNDQIKDKVVWVGRDNKEVNFSTKVAWLSLRDNWPKVQWSHVVWYSQYNHKQAFILWLPIHGRLMTQDRIMKWNQGNLYSTPDILARVMEIIAAKPFKNNIWRILQRLIISYVVYHIWQERNKRIFQNKEKSLEVLCSCITDDVENKLRTMTVKETHAVLAVAKEWELSWVNKKLVK
nr:RNA-directed DNA polymerase, eukaryota, reverse transcriptase zinc-binding domain protein [Tanacetum cinerariifolium]